MCKFIAVKVGFRYTCWNFNRNLLAFGEEGRKTSPHQHYRASDSLQQVMMTNTGVLPFSVQLHVHTQVLEVMQTTVSILSEIQNITVTSMYCESVVQSA